MPFPRSLLIPNGADCLVHTISRCVRRAWLCGDDPYSGKNFDHRREWVRDRAKMLVNHFAVEVLAYAVMSNHSHFVLWVRPSVAAGWSAEEVARRWLSVFGKRVDGPTEQDIGQAVANAERIELWRGRLGDVSWFMRCLNEWLARKANAEDECTGRFWEGRFTSQLLEDEGAVLACMAYVDLNPVRARMATSLEESRLTSVHDRICARRARQRLKTVSLHDSGHTGNLMEGEGAGEVGSRGQGSDAVKGGNERPSWGSAIPGESGEGELTRERKAMIEDAKAEGERDVWLCRFADEAVRVKGCAPSDFVEEGAGAHTVLGMGFADYVELLEWTGKCVIEGRVKGCAPRDRIERGVLPEAARPVLERMELDVENWVGTVEQYGGLYWRVAGKVENLKRKAAELGRQWLAGQRKSRGVFRLPRTSRGRKAREKDSA
jgi:REP element-mobilizing transposase RayT